MIEWNGEKALALARQFSESRVVLTGAELDVFTVLSGRPLSVEQVAERVGADVAPLAKLLDALAAMELLRKSDGAYRTHPDLVPLLSSDSPSSVLPMILHSTGMWNTWSGLTGKVRGSHGTTPTSEEAEAARMKAFIGAMHVVGAQVAAKVASAVAPGVARNLIDVGGGSGTYSIAFLRESPGLCATLFDRPQVIEMARERLTAEGLLDRVTLAPGDFYADPLPGGHDLALLSAIIHQNSMEQNVDLYRKIHAALVPGGRLVIRDHIMDDTRTSPRGGALFAINMLVATPAGGTYTFDEIRVGLEEAGFERVGLVQGDRQMDGLVEAYKG